MEKSKLDWMLTPYKWLVSNPFVYIIVAIPAMVFTIGWLDGTTVADIIVLALMIPLLLKIIRFLYLW